MRDATEWEHAEDIANLPQVDELLQDFADDPTGDNGTMIVREVIRAMQSQAQQSQWMPIETAPTGKEFLLAFYYRHRPHDVLRRVVTFIDKDIIALGWSEIPPAPEGE